jgi:hypothetical protein
MDFLGRKWPDNAFINGLCAQGVLWPDVTVSRKEGWLWIGGLFLNRVRLTEEFTPVMSLFREFLGPQPIHGFNRDLPALEPS